ncbi:MAG: outer membrane protein transport protein [Pseudomonadota bacterium]
MTLRSFLLAGLGASIAALATASTFSAVDAGGFALRQQGTASQGMSYAGAAAGSLLSPSSMYWNGATITLHEGRTFEANAAGILTQSTIDLPTAFTPRTGGALPAGGDQSSEIGLFAIVPASYTVVQLTDQIFFGNSINGPFGLGSDADDDYAGRFHGIESELSTYTANPTLAFKFNDYVSASIGATIMYSKVALKSRTFGGAFGEGISDLTGDDWGFGFTAGVMLTPIPTTRIGLGFRSGIEIEYEGEAELTFPNPAANQTFDIEADLHLPEIVTLSVSHDFNARFTGTATVEWTNWSRFEELRVRRASDGVTVNLVEQNWDDGWYFAIGGEYQATDKLTVRGGVGYELTPVPDEMRTPRIPDEDRVWLSIGATYAPTDRLKLSAAYTYIFIDDGSINRANANDADPLVGGLGDLGGISGEARDQSVNMLSLSASYKFGGEPVFRR